MHFHADRDEERYFVDGTWVHPTLSSVLYTNNVGGGTLILSQR